ncbi:MAG: gluconokinase [Bacteroidota bacterium]|nr:gluconokinase [Bacteroidota bacterium]
MVCIIMGVSGCGKSTVGEQLAPRLGLPYYDGDAFHSAANIEKMRHGIPLTDDDRRDWLATLATKLGEWETTGGAILACSALKEAYRTTLQIGVKTPIHWIFLDGPRELLLERMGGRKGHYMHANMLASQLAILERPAYALTLAITATPEALVQQIVAAKQQDAAFGTKPATQPA